MISFLSRSFAAMPHWIPRRCWIYPPGPQGDEEMSAECWVNNWKPKSARNKQKSSKILVGYTVVDSGTSAKCKIETPNVWQKRWKTNNTISQHKFGYESLLAHKHLTPKTRHLKTFNFQVALAVTFRDYVARLTAARIDPRSFTLKSFSAHWERKWRRIVRVATKKHQQKHPVSRRKAKAFPTPKKTNIQGLEAENGRYFTWFWISLFKKDHFQFSRCCRVMKFPRLRQLSNQSSKRLKDFAVWAPRFKGDHVEVRFQDSIIIQGCQLQPYNGRLG